ncbi:MAG TPA: hypothetical protein VK477_01560, partial [Acidobacteriota bacterium]|nr:hypothetical protein [Acidobacteriota bacterium]
VNWDVGRWSAALAYRKQLDQLGAAREVLPRRLAGAETPAARSLSFHLLEPARRRFPFPEARPETVALFAAQPPGVAYSDSTKYLVKITRFAYIRY